ncbi:MAG: hypothetical protein ACRC2R_20340 [Xenococcaceae cyanobacterium]
MNNTSQLIDTLNKLELWLQKNIPKKASQLKPGLSYQKIKEQVKLLPFEVPESIYQLYQWHDGAVDKFVFNNYNFLSLESALYIYEEWLAEIKYNEVKQAYFFEYSFPLLENWAENGVLLNVNCKTNNSYPIQMLDISCHDFSIRYNNLTNFFLHILAWYKSARYYEEYSVWEVKAEIEWELQAKYMTQEYILQFIKNSSTYPAQKEIYKKYIAT